MKDEKRLTKIGIISILPGIALISIGIVLTFIYLFTSHAIMQNNIDNIKLSYTVTESEHEFDLTLEKGEYKIWYWEDEYLGEVSIFINGTCIEKNLTQDLKNDTAKRYNEEELRFCLCSFITTERSAVHIEKTGDGGFTLSGSDSRQIDHALSNIGLAMVVSGLLLTFPGLIIMFYLNRNDARALSMMRKREREELKKVRFDIKNPKQVAGALLIFVLGPVSIAFSLAFPFYFEFDWYGFLKLPLIIFGVVSFIIGYQMFYNKQMLGPGGQLSFRRAPVDPSKSVPFYQCHICQRFNKLGIGEVPKDLTCERCGTQLYREGQKVSNENFVMIACPLCRSIIVFPARSGEINCPNCGISLSIKVKEKDDQGH